MSLKKNVKMQLPKNCKHLSVQEMMENESGWYVNFNTGEVFVTYKDVDTTIRWIVSITETFDMAADVTYIEAEIKKNKPMHMGPQGDSSGGIGVSFNENGFKIFALNEEQLKLANSNIFIF